MPKRTRDEVKQDLGRSIGNLDAAKEKIGRWIEPYGKHHPELAAAMQLIVESINLTIDFVNSLEEQI